MRVLIIEDDPDVSRFVEKGLKTEGFAVDVIDSGQIGLETAKANNYDLVVLDFYLPDMNGLEIARGIRKRKKHIPIIVLTGELQIETKVKMLDYCDDYITKPFSIQELMARMRAVSRRGAVLFRNALRVDDLSMDLRSHKVIRAGKEIALRNKEFSLLECLMRNQGIVLSRLTLLEKVWDMNTDPFTNTVDVHIRFLRKKVDSGYPKKLIHTVPTRGYKIEG